jgi:hypothetical protein
MPLQNRVTPFGELIATPQRGTLMGNRGCLHDDRRQIRRRFVGQRWIACVLAFRGRRRTVMAPHRYTELFFLDEATALAAGHRPCCECQRDRYHLFREHWAAANSDAAGVLPSADDMDRVLHAERVEGKGDKRTYSELLARLPAGVLIADKVGNAYLVRDGDLLLWTPGGYLATMDGPVGAVQVLTPRSIVRAIANGYPVELHGSASAGLIEIDGCIFDEGQWRHAHGYETLDPVGREAFVNHIHLDGKARFVEAERIVQSWAEELRARWPARTFRIYRQIDGREVTVRFHEVRPGLPNWSEQGGEIVTVTGEFRAESDRA